MLAASQHRMQKNNNAVAALLFRNFCTEVAGDGTG
jgi:hypothetical protein